MAEDPIAQSEISALTSRFEFGIVKSDLTAVRLQMGNLDPKVGGLEVSRLAEETRGLNAKIDRNQAQIVELLTALDGKDQNEN